MKTNKHISFPELPEKEHYQVFGGGFWGELFYVLGATAKSIVIFGQEAANFQASLPADLKK